MASVILKEIDKEYENGFHAVKKVSVDIKDKEFVVLLGPSGCGKTTTLRMVAGLEDITKGDLEIDGKRMNDVLPKDRDIAMVFQNYALYPHMSVYENMAFGLKLRKIPKDEIKQRVMEAARILKLDPVLDRKPKQLSGGQRQRVALGRAIVRKPKVFLFDEPLSNLDAKLRGHMRAELADLHTRLDTTMIYVTHDQIEAMTLGDKIIIMQAGIIEQVGTPLQLYDHPVNKFVAGFIGTPPMNMFEVKVGVKGQNIELVGKDCRVVVSGSRFEVLKGYDGKTVIFGARPENIVRATTQDKNNYIVGTAAVVEQLGAETYVYVPRDDGEAIVGDDSEKEGKNFLIMKLHREKDVKVGSEISFKVDTESIHIFDKVTEDSLVGHE